jgi:aminopeptidase N
MGTEKTAELRSYGINVVGVPFMNEKLSHLIPNAVAWVENGSLRIYEGEVKLLEQMASYYWETSESGKLKTKKASDDFVDSLLLALRDWRFVDVLGEAEDNMPAAPTVSVYNFPQTERFLKILRGEYSEPV